MIELWPGDIALTAGNTKLGRFIRWGERRRGEKPARVNHAALGAKFPNIIIESDAVVRKVPILQFHAKDGIIIYRPLKLTSDQIQTVVDVATTWIGKPYPVKDLLAYLIDNKVFGGRTVARWLLRTKATGVCSRLVSYAYAAAGASFGKPEPDPDDIDDYCRSHPDEYQLVYQQNMETTS